MRAYLERLFTKVAHEDEDLGIARHIEVTDLMRGIYGPGLMLDAILELEADRLGPKSLPDQVHAADALKCGRQAMPSMDLCRGEAPTSLDMQALLEKLVWLRRDWADATVVDLVAGGYGPELQKMAVYAIANGLGDDQSGYTSLIYECYAADRGNLVQSIADLGLPDFLAEAALQRHPLATTSTGQWLDLLVHTDFANWTPEMGASRSCLPNLLGTFDKPGYLCVLAELLAKHDPEHKGIHQIRGSARHALVMVAVMNRRIDASELPAPAASSTSIHRNRAL
ncbi:hypothetical protein [Roseateles asaccharophilus]|uniref:hypothetical protein n=1 Tax=Roseateles asaccharophilus TaxID=582607 RepID=UPI00384D2142